MNALKVIIFDVERGLCVFVRTPTGYGIMIDCGRSKDFSPAEWISSNEAPTLSPWNGKRLYKLIVTHPHDDHVEDIESVRKLLPPATLQRHTEYDWSAVLNPPDHDPSSNAKAYYEWQKGYNAPVTDVPDLGLDLKVFSISPREAAAITADTQHSLNNSSLVTVLTYTAPIIGTTWKVVISGDNETAGWFELLKNSKFRDAIAGADFFVTSHHGHASGFCKELFDVMGQPLLNISSERSGDKSVFDYGPYAKGIEVGGRTRSHVVTRSESHITVTMVGNRYDVYMN